MFCAVSIDIHGRSQNLRHLDSGMGLKLGVFGFSRNQNNRSLSSSYVTCIYCGLSVKINTRKMPHDVNRLWVYLFALIFACVVGKNPKTPQFEPHGRRRYYTERYRRSGISRIYLWLYLKISNTLKNDTCILQLIVQGI